MPRESRRKLVEKILRSVRRFGPMILTEISAQSRCNAETVKSCVRTMTRRGQLIVMDDLRATGSGPAKQYDVPRLNPWVSRRAPPTDAETAVIAALERWASCALKRDNSALTDHERTVFWAIEAAMKNMPVIQAIAVMHVHGCSVWVFRRLDMGEVYREALAVIARRVEPLLVRREEGGP